MKIVAKAFIAINIVVAGVLIIGVNKINNKEEAEKHESILNEEIANLKKEVERLEKLNIKKKNPLFFRK